MEKEEFWSGADSYSKFGESSQGQFLATDTIWDLVSTGLNYTILNPIILD